MASKERVRVPVALTDATFDGFARENRYAVVDCWAAWCPPCRILSPIIDQLAEERGDVAFGKLNVDENPVVTRRFGIMAIPTLLYFADGKLVNRTAGALPKHAVEDRLNSLLS